MIEVKLSFEYWNKLAEQTVFISALLGGFSIAVIVSLLYNEKTNRLSRNLFRAAIIAAASFLVSVFSMTKIIMITSPGFPFKVTKAMLSFPRIVGSASLLIGVISLMTIIALSGWTKSRRMGIFTTTIGGLGFILIILMLT